MSTDKHTADLRNVCEDDHVTLTTSEGETFEATCTHYLINNADPRSGEVRETTIWRFETPWGHAAATITDGLRSAEDDPDFPQHSELWHLDEGDGMGYITTVEIHGPKLDA